MEKKGQTFFIKSAKINALLLMEGSVQTRSEKGTRTNSLFNCLLPIFIYFFFYLFIFPL